MGYNRLHRIYYAGLRVGRTPSAELKCAGCCLYFAKHLTRPVLGFDLCLDCADRVEAQEQRRGDELSRQAGYYTPDHTPTTEEDSSR